jgi:hypothetical protein
MWMDGHTIPEVLRADADESAPALRQMACRPRLENKVSDHFVAKPELARVVRI